MRLEKFKEKKVKRKWIIGSGITLILLFAVVVLIRSYAIYEETTEYDVIEGKVPSFLSDYDVKLAVTIDGNPSTQIPLPSSGKVIESIICDKGAIGGWDYHNWMLEVKNITETRTKCQVNFVDPYQENLLNGVEPVLKDGLIPVTITNDGKVYKASLGREWYSYQNKVWANAVILNDEKIKYGEGEEIPEENIESYFVWIPKYRYQLWDLGEYEGLTEVDNSKVHEIPVIFGDYDTQDKDGECKTPMLSGESGNCKVGDYMTHPAFISMNTKGLWVGKFETGYKGSTDKTSAEHNVIEPESIQIKPNVSSWRSIQVANAFYSSYDYKRELDSHMMKNTEWGAVAYLQHSKYGNTIKIRSNNNSNYVTGYSAVNEPTCGFTGTNDECNKYGTSEDITKPWNTEVGYLASTTGNISGIYDMSGGAWDYVMGFIVNQEGKLITGMNSQNNSGFNGQFGGPTYNGDTSGLTELTTGVDFPSDSRYYNQYNFKDSNSDYSRRILGDATGEMGPFETAVYLKDERHISSWHDDDLLFIRVLYSLFVRGGHFWYGYGSGVYSAGVSNGNANDWSGYRVVLSP